MKSFVSKLALVLVFGITSLVVFSCKDAKKEEITALKSEVMAVHDEMMPKMDEIFRMKKTLLSIKDTSENADSISNERTEKIQSGIDGLLQAEKVMMDWMRAYKGNTIQDKDSLLLYLREEKEVVQNMKSKMQEGIELGKAAIEVYGQ